METWQNIRPHSKQRTVCYGSAYNTWDCAWVKDLSPSDLRLLWLWRVWEAAEGQLSNVAELPESLGFF